ncbi:MAG TPA: antibiotic biosynthesis monooxygenase family protein [Geminicoccus sp.]|jgi:heme-degrading monooxygenase HmoA|uniref:antibiotic biosynthesis monooxygenase family protein n=1 Tax=Geminicoccus sp. TaxID=2024832 RepID=UPI002E2EB671|nr:antibiotic biosynthesis monooxygenase family protein [Geminicoccus sp.]HEX2527383.1 antibiotic biosynthesis monooxygenase family protein [Geminicoccus sp.]
MSEVILINPFEVPDGAEADALAYWDRAADHLRRQPGFVSTRLHRALGPGARFPLVNLAVWRSSADFLQAVTSPPFQRLSADGRERFPHYPALYEVVRS